MEEFKEKHLFNKTECINHIINLKKFYENENFDKDKENTLLKLVIEECSRDKSCPPGYYKLYGKCLFG
jgi:hypothetical protein